jgi:hypothetical protein
MTGANDPATRTARPFRALGKALVGCLVAAVLVVLLRYGTPNPLVDERFEHPPPEAERLRELAERIVREHAGPDGQIARSPTRDIELEGTDGLGIERWTVYGRVNDRPWRVTARREGGTWHPERLVIGLEQRRLEPGPSPDP